jgi:UDP-glucose 4-epimerase
MKYVAGESFIANNPESNLSTLIYGNVTNSTGSIIPLIWNFINSNKVLELYNPEMTRFLLDVEDAVDLVIKSTKYKGCNLLSVSKSFRVKDMFEIFSENFGLRYKITTERVGEKVHEIMASNEETRRIEYIKEDNIYLLHPNKILDSVHFINDEYSSKNFCVSKDELFIYLKNKNFFK